MQTAKVQPGDMLLFDVSDLDSRMKAITYVTWKSATDTFTIEWISVVTANVPARSDAGDIHAVFETLKRSCRYQFHPFGTDRFQTLRRTLTLAMGVRADDPDLLAKWIAAFQRGEKTGSADCDVSTCALTSALHDLGFIVGARIYSMDGESYGHIAALVWPIRNSEPPTHPDGTYDTSRWLVLELTVGPDGTPNSAVVGYEIPHASVRGVRDYVFSLAN